jgi:hypothetical protein
MLLGLLVLLGLAAGMGWVWRRRQHGGAAVAGRPSRSSDYQMKMDGACCCLCVEIDSDLLLVSLKGFDRSVLPAQTELQQQGSQAGLREPV